jgi:hypothetical protein
MIYSMRTFVLLIATLALSPLSFSCGRNSGPAGGDQGGTVTLMITSDPQNATIYVDNVSTGQMTPDTLDIASGDHTVSLKLCDYNDWEKSYSGADGDTLSFQASLTLKFDFSDDFNTGGGNWTAGCPVRFSEIDSHNGTGYLLIIDNAACSTELIDSYEVPTCLSPTISFWYKLTTPGSVGVNLKIDAEGGPRYQRLDATSTWTRIDVQSSEIEGLLGPAMFSFEFSPAGSDTFRFSLDDFSLHAE